MPIRFRCVYCDKLLGIARRKAGAVVNCPQCQQPLIVPNAGARAGTDRVRRGRDKLFERDDLVDMLGNPDQTYRGWRSPGPGPVRTADPPTTFPSVPQNRTASSARTQKSASQGIV